MNLGLSKAVLYLVDTNVQAEPFSSNGRNTFGRAIFAVSDMRKVRARFSTSDISLIKSDQHFRGQYYVNEVDIFGITKW